MADLSRDLGRHDADIENLKATVQQIRQDVADIKAIVQQVKGGGANIVPVWSDSTNWRIG